VRLIHAIDDGFLITAGATRALHWLVLERLSAPRVIFLNSSTHYGDSLGRESPKKQPLNSDLTDEAAVWDAAWASAYALAPR
jgi:hypothetical protein